MSLSEDQHSIARNLVEQGRFASLSAVLQQGVELFRQEIADESQDRAALAELLAERAAGKFISMPEMDANLARMLEDKRKAQESPALELVKAIGTRQETKAA